MLYYLNVGVSSTDSKKTSSDPNIFPYIVHIIFAVVIATSYTIVADIYVSEETIVFDNFITINTLELILAYVVLILGWIGYSYAIREWEYTFSVYGLSRFCIDTTILLIYFLLIILTATEHGFKDYFHILMILLFVLFVIWKGCAIKEYNDDKELKNSLRITIIFGLLQIIITGLVLFVYYEKHHEYIGYPIILSFLIIFWICYRYSERPDWKKLK